jgi:ATP-binding cassette subfamily A (ABC1) protein 3
LDEADFLADNIAIMYKGQIKAHGTSSTLKNSYGNGYTIKLLAQNHDLDIPLSGPAEKEVVRHQVPRRAENCRLPGLWSHL